MATYVRTHTPGEGTTLGSQVTALASATVAPGNTLVAILAGDDALAVDSISKPGGETAAWVRVAHQNATGVFIEVWAIKTTTAWASGYAVFATLNSNANGRAIQLLEYAGVSTAIQTVDADTGIQTTTVATSTDVVPGDLLIGAVAVNTAGTSAYRVTQSGSSGTAVGTSVGLSSQRPGYKIETNAHLLSVTGAGSQSDTYSALQYLAPRNTPVVAVMVGLESDDYPPDVPTLTSMAGGGTINRGATNRASHTFSSANFGDSQSKFDLRYRLAGAPSWTTILAAGTTALYYDFAPGSLAAGDYERQVKVYGALGKDSGWSPSGFFTAADAPDGPTFIYPIDGQSVDQFETVTWSTPDGQESYQLRRLLDVAGSPGAVIAGTDTGEVVDAVTRSLPLNFSVNNRAEHIEIRVKVDGLWSEWDDVLVDVSYSPPPTPSRTLYADIATATILVVIDNPAPTGDDPAAVYNDIYVDDGKGEQRRATGVSTNGSWRYMTPVSSRDYELSIRVVAVAANGTTSSE